MTGPAHTKQPSRTISPTCAMCSTGSMLSGGSYRRRWLIDSTWPWHFVSEPYCPVGGGLVPQASSQGRQLRPLQSGDLVYQSRFESPQTPRSMSTAGIRVVSVRVGYSRPEVGP